MALYLSGKTPKMIIYSGEVVRCYPNAPGGCRTNIEMEINELDDVCQVQGMHQANFLWQSRSAAPNVLPALRNRAGELRAR